jgi:hypothetical protein
MVAVLADQHLRYQRLGRHAAVDWRVGSRGLDDSIFAGAAAITRPADQPNPELSGDVIQHLSLIFADPMQRTAAAGTNFVLDVDDDLDPRQMGGPGATIALRRFAGGWPGLRLGRRRQPSHLLGQFRTADAGWHAPVDAFQRRPTGISPLVSLTNLWPKWSRFGIGDILSLGGHSGLSAARRTKAVISRLHTKSSIETEQVCWFQYLQLNLMKPTRIGQN